MRFCKQRDRYSCGAVALLNVDKFFGYQVTYKDLAYYRDLVGCKKEQGGTFARGITKVLGNANRRSWKKSKEFLQQGNCILVFTYKKWGHFYLITTDKNGCFITVNRYRRCQSSLQILPHAAARLLKCAKLTWYIKEEML